MEKEKAFFFERPDGARLFGIYHPAESSLQGETPGPVILYCNPIFEEHLCSHRISVNFARHASRCGFSVLRFDYFGDGESEGLFEDASVSSRVNDIISAIVYLKSTTQPSKIFLLGLRFGATLAMLAAEKEPSITGVVAWAPIINAHDYLYALLRSNLTTQLAMYKKVIHDRDALVEQILGGSTVNVDGYEIGKPLFEEAGEVDLTRRKLDFAKKMLLLQISLSTTQEKPLKDFVAINGASSVDFAAIKEEKFWNPLATVYPPCEELFTKTTDWLQNNFPVVKGMY